MLPVGVGGLDDQGVDRPGRRLRVAHYGQAAAADVAGEHHPLVTPLGYPEVDRRRAQNVAGLQELERHVLSEVEDPAVGHADHLLIVAGLVDDETLRAALWIVGLSIDYAGPYVFGVSGFRVSPGHFAERFSLIVIIALGESIVAIGAGVTGELDAGLLVAALLGLTVACGLWWAYFDVVAVVAERRFRQMPPDLRVRIARDSYSYLHLPMIAGIVLVALGAKKTVGHVDKPLDTVPAVALLGGIALYYAAHVAFRLRNVGTLNRQRLAAVVIALALIPLALEVDALIALACAAALTSGLIGYETIHLREARERIRHQQGSM